MKERAYTPIYIVAPFMGAWIEISIRQRGVWQATVAPFMGAWIEITLGLDDEEINTSLPLWERGLKCQHCQSRIPAQRGRSLRRSVN